MFNYQTVVLNCLTFISVFLFKVAHTTSFDFLFLASR